MPLSVQERFQESMRNLGDSVRVLLRSMGDQQGNDPTDQQVDDLVAQIDAAAAQATTLSQL